MKSVLSLHDPVAQLVKINNSIRPLEKYILLLFSLSRRLIERMKNAEHQLQTSQLSLKCEICCHVHSSDQKSHLIISRSRNLWNVAAESHQASGFEPSTDLRSPKSNRIPFNHRHGNNNWS